MSVDATIAGQCVRVVHRDVAIERLVTVVRGHLHADDTFSAEHVMVAVDPRVAELNGMHRHATDPGATS